MSYISIHEKYLNKLRERRQDPFYQKMMAGTVRSMSGQYGQVIEEMSEQMKREGMPAQTIMQGYLDAAKQWTGAVSDVGQHYSGLEEQRRDELNQRIEQGEYNLELAREQEKQKKKAEKEAKTRNILQLGGGALGALLAAPTGGMSMLMGAQLGYGAGSVVGGMTGSQPDFGMVQQGLIDTMGSISTIQALKKNQELTESMAGFYEIYPQLSPEQQNQFKLEYMQNQTNPQAIQEIINRYLGLVKYNPQFAN